MLNNPSNTLLYIFKNSFYASEVYKSRLTKLLVLASTSFKDFKKTKLIFFNLFEWWAMNVLLIYRGTSIKKRRIRHSSA